MIRQLLQFKFTSYRKGWYWHTIKPCFVPESQIEHVKFDNPINIRLTEHLISAYSHITPIVDYNHEPRMLILCRIERKSNYYILNIQLPLFIITTCSFTSLFVDSSEIGDRLSVSVTILLAAIAYQYVIVEMLPHSSHLSYMSLFILATLIEAALIIIENSIAHHISDHVSEIAMIVILVLMWIGINVSFIIIGGRRKSWKELQTMNDNINNHETAFLNVESQDITAQTDKDWDL